MKRIKLDKLSDIITRNTDNPNSFIGFDTTKNIDVNGTEYELKNDEDKYYFFDKLGDNSIFVSETHLFDVLLGDYIKDIESGSIYEHGYPESRLIPSNHYEECQNSCLERILGDISKKVSSTINQHF